jgi:hypothetical protein
MTKFIVAIETVKIKEFLFSTNKLKVIRGASYLLDYLNQVEVPKILDKNGIKDENIIYVGAGNAKFFTDTKEKAEKIIKEVKEKYEIEAPGVKVVGISKIYEENSDKKVWDIFDDLALETAKAKSKGFSLLNIDLPYVEKCELNSDEVAEIYSENLEKDLNHVVERYKENDLFRFKIDKGFISHKDIDRKVELDFLKKQINRLTKTVGESTGKISEGTFWKILYSNFVKSYDKDEVGFYRYVRLEKEIELDNETTIDNFEDEDSFIGFMYSDGDGIGDFLKNIKEIFIELDKNDEIKKQYNIDPEKAYLDFLSAFSKGLDKVTKESLTEVLDEIFSNEKNKEKKWGEFLIVGGDDVCAVFDPTLVLKISNEFQKLFETKMLELMEQIALGSKNKENTPKKELPDSLKSAIKNTRITSSSGVVIAKTKTPMFQLFKQGLKLQKNAKKERKEVKKIFPSFPITGFIDFQVIGAEGTVNIDSFRNSLSKVIDRPYAIDFDVDSRNEEEKNKKNVKNLDSLLKLIYEMKNINFPTNKLRYIYDLKRNQNLDDTKKKINFINILSKMNQEHIKFIVNDLELDYKDPNTFENNFNNIFDILEIYDFIEEKEEKTNEN